MGSKGRSTGARVLVCGLVLACAGVSRTPAAGLVHFVDGRSLEVESCLLEKGRAVLAFQGGRLVVPADRILRVEELAPVPPPAAAPEGSTGVTPPDPRPTPASPAPGAAAPKADVVDELAAIIEEAAERHGVDPALIAAVIAAESGFRGEAVSPKGALGLMQLMPATARDLSVSDPFDARQNVEAGTRHLRSLLDQYRGPRGEESFVRALAAYNAGGGRVTRYQGVPPFRETIEYIHRVLRYYAAPQAR